MNATSLQAKLESSFSDIADAMFGITQKDETRYLHHSAKARLVEARALMLLAAEQPYPFRKELRPLSAEFNEFIAAIEKRNNRMIDEVDGNVAEQMEKREQAALWLDQARIMATLTLVHLSHALDETTPPPANLKAI